MKRTAVVTYTRAAFHPHISPTLAAHIDASHLFLDSKSDVLVTLEHLLSITKPATLLAPLKQAHSNLHALRVFISSSDIGGGVRRTLNKAVVLLLPNQQQFRLSAEGYVDACVSAGADVCFALNDYPLLNRVGVSQTSECEEKKEKLVKRAKIDEEEHSVSVADVKRNMRFLAAQLTYLKQLATASPTANRMLLYATVQGGEELIPKLNASTILDECDGFVVRVPSNTSFTQHMTTLPPCVQDQSIGKRKPLFVYGIRSVRDLREALAHSVDFIDDSWAHTATAMNISLDLTHALANLVIDADNTETAVKESDWRGKLERLAGGCECMTCTQHTKAYIFHLVERGEISATTLLQVHNMYQIRWFVDAKRCVPL